MMHLYYVLKCFDWLPGGGGAIGVVGGGGAGGSGGAATGEGQHLLPKFHQA